MKPLTYVAPSHLIPLYLAWQQNPRSTNYQLTFSYQIKQPESVALLLEKTQQLVRAKAYLRQSFAIEGEQLLATIHDDINLKVNHLSTSDADFSQLEQDLIVAPHDLTNNIPIKLTVVHNADCDDYLVLFSIHHIAIDATCFDFLIADLNRLLNNQAIQVETAADYRKQIADETVLTDKNNSNSFNHYLNHIQKIDSELDHPTINNPHNIYHYTQQAPATLIELLSSTANTQKISPFNLLLIAYGVFLARISNQDNVLINYPSNIRHNKQINGCFINILILPLCLTESISYSELLSWWSAELPTMKTIATSRIDNKITLKEAPNFSALTFEQLDDLHINGKQYRAKSYPQIANGTISLKYRQKNNCLHFVCDVLAELFPQHFSATLLQRFFMFSERLLTHANKPVTTIDLLFKDERKKLLIDFNQTDAPLPTHQTLVDWFDSIVQQYPDNIAVSAPNGEITYRKLDNKATAIAAYLIQQNINPDNLIGILIDNRLEMIIAVIAVLKAGAAYIPIAHDTPHERIKTIIQDSEMRFLLSVPTLTNDSDYPVAIIDINQPITQHYHYRKPSLNSRHLAYAIYTSGTTGKPKGILIEHRSVVNYVNFLIKDNHIDATTIGSKYIGFSFDISVTEIYPILLAGGKLCIIRDEDRSDCSKINDFFIKNHVAYACLPTHMGEQFFKFNNTTLKVLGLGGEKLNYFIPQKYRVVNIYGPTETTVQPTRFIVCQQENNIPIGNPIDNVKCYIVDKHLNLLPIGVTGELCVSSMNLARAYLNHDSTTQQKFVANPFTNPVEQNNGYNRLYKSGDLARWLPSGNLEYLGRADFQIKLLGYRIELEEIESIISRFPGIIHSAVLLKKTKKYSYLAAYYSSEKIIKENDLLDYLKKYLPSHMIPAAFVAVKKFPLTLSGKINRKILPESNLHEGKQYIAPQTQQQKLICECFSEVLSSKKIGINSDFFEFGGSSIQAISLVSKLQKYFSVTVTDVFCYKTPKKLAEHIHFSQDALKNRLLQLKKGAIVNNNIRSIKEKEISRKVFGYTTKINESCHSKEQDKIKTVLLTGATGYLGCHLLYQLLHSTPYNIILLIRKTATTAFQRINDRFNFYFDQSLGIHSSRITIFESDLEKKQLGLSQLDYYTLSSTVDSIIHAAALVKHYGEYSLFYSANVQATINLLEFCQLTTQKAFHHISTYSVLGGAKSQQRYPLFTEDDYIDSSNFSTNFYIKTKQQAEQQVLTFQQQGVKANIYRVGNLAFAANNGRMQQNKQDNAFFNRMQILIRLGVVAEEISGTEEISPVDLTAQAVILLFDKKNLKNQTLHVFNPAVYHADKFLIECKSINVKKQSAALFIDLLIEKLADFKQRRWVERFLLHQNWLQDDQKVDKSVRILQNKTHATLNYLGFNWLEFDISSGLNRYLENVAALLT